MKNKEYSCGIGSWHPKWLQWMAKPSVFLIMMSTTSLIQGGSYTYFIASMSTLEKRFAFSSQISGLILIADNIPELTLAPVFGYLANRLHRPRLIGCSYILVGLGLYLAALPFFIYGPATHLLSRDKNSFNNKSTEFCDKNNEFNNICEENEESKSDTNIMAVVMIFMGCFMDGFGYTAYFTVGIPFVDDSVKKKNSPLYISSIGALRILGPTIGFMLSSLCLTFYENPLVDPGIERTDPRWVGCWWIGFLILGTILIVASFPLFLFPAEFKTKELNDLKTKGILKIRDKNENKPEISLWIRIKRLIKNPIYDCFVIGTALRFFAVLGYWTYKAKYIESAYQKSASAANLFTGLIAVVPTATGIFLGGFLIQRFRPKPIVLTCFITTVEICAIIGLFSAIFLGCPQREFAGIQNENLELKTECNSNCFCSQKTFQPICGPNERTNYFSACFGGCNNSSLIGTNKYSNCECFDGMAREGLCETNCGNNFLFYITLLGIGNIVGNLAKTGNSIISFRIVDPLDKSFAVGLAGAFCCLFAFIPYPLVYGFITDSACLIWEEKCGKRGNCWVYDNYKFRTRLHALTLCLYLSGSVFDIIVVFLSNRIKNLYEEEDNNESYVQNNISLISLRDLEIH